MPTRAVRKPYEPPLRQPVSLRTQQREVAAGVVPAVQPVRDEVIETERRRIARALMGEGYLGMSGA
jgi:hypothetical protein